jgi:hypothetical protein
LLGLAEETVGLNGETYLDVVPWEDEDLIAEEMCKRV